MDSQLIALSDATNRFNEPQNGLEYSLNANIRSKSLKFNRLSYQKITSEQENQILKAHTSHPKNYDQNMKATCKHRKQQKNQYEKINIQEKVNQNFLYKVFEITSQLKEQKANSHDQYEQIKSCDSEEIKTKIKSIALSERNLIFIDSQNKIHFQDKNKKQNTRLSNIVNQFFFKKQVSNVHVYSTQFSTFFIDQAQNLYGFGLNDRGQLGINHLESINQPQKIFLPFQSLESAVRSENFIKKIVGGPFHTVILTDSNKVCYAGSLYGEQEIQADYCICSFTELRIKNESIKDVESGLTSIIFLTNSNKIFVMGLFEQKKCFSCPFQISFRTKSAIRKISIANDNIYAMSQSNQLFKIQVEKAQPIEEIKVQQFPLFLHSSCSRHIVQMESSFDTIIFIIKQKATSTQSQKFYYFIESQQPSQTKNSKRFSQLSLPNKSILPCKMIISKSHLYFLFNEDSNTQMDDCLDRLEQIQQKIKRHSQQKLKPKESKSIGSCEKKKKPQKENKTQLISSNLEFNFYQGVTPRTFSHNLEVQFSEIKLISKIAEGGYGVIYKGLWKKTIVAVKIFKIDQNNSNSIKQFISECRAMEALRHPNIVMFLGACLKPPNFAIILEYCEGGTLWSHLQNHKIEFPWVERLHVAVQIAKAMNYLHDRKNPIVHRDLKSLNVLLDVNKKVKIADFGWTKSLENYMTSKIGTYQWMAPEVLTGQKYTEKADIFSYSIILWEIAARQPPYRNFNGIQVAYDVANKQYRPSIPVNTPVEFKELICACWQRNPERRPSFIQIIDCLQKQAKDVKLQI